MPLEENVSLWRGDRIKETWGGRSEVVASFISRPINRQWRLRQTLYRPLIVCLYHPPSREEHQTFVEFDSCRFHLMFVNDCRLDSDANFDGTKPQAIWLFTALLPSGLKSTIPSFFLSFHYVKICKMEDFFLFFPFTIYIEYSTSQRIGSCPSSVPCRVRYPLRYSSKSLGRCLSSNRSTCSTVGSIFFSFLFVSLQLKEWTHTKCVRRALFFSSTS